jgi:hypothetical protein
LHLVSASSDPVLIKTTGSSTYNSLIFENDTGSKVAVGIGGSTVGGSVQDAGYVGTISNKTFYINTNNTQRITVTNAGPVGIGNAASNANGGILQLSSGITFPATAVAASDANTLDDYEEGTWTGTDASPAGLSIVFTDPKYTKIGKIVYVNASAITYPATASIANAAIGGLPFTNGGANVGVAALVATNVNANRALVVGSTTTAFFYANSSVTQATNAQLSGAVISGFSAVYQV